MALLDQYLSQFEPLQRASRAAALKRLLRINGEIAPRWQHAERLAALPAFAYDPVKGRLTTAGDGRFLAVEDISRTLVDYALFVRGRS